MRIFMVEDDETSRWFLAQYLEKCGHTVIQAASQEEALTLWPTAGCDVLLSDFQFPGGNGAELKRLLPPPPPVFAIAMSGSAKPEDWVSLMEVGFQRYLAKPFTLADLDVALEAAAVAVTQCG